VAINRTADYYSEVGSYRGTVKKYGMWIAVKDLNRIDKTGMQRWQGPPSKAISTAMKEQIPIRADLLLYKRKIK